MSEQEFLQKILKMAQNLQDEYDLTTLRVGFCDIEKLCQERLMLLEQGLLQPLRSPDLVPVQWGDGWKAYIKSVAREVIREDMPGIVEAARLHIDAIRIQSERRRI